MKKYIAGVLVSTAILGLVGLGTVHKAEAQTFTMKQLVELLIALDVIAPDKVNLARAFVGLPPLATSTIPVRTITPTVSTQQSMQTSPVNTPVVEPVVIMEKPTIAISGSMVGNKFVIPLSVSGSDWTKVYYAFVRKDGGSSSKGFFYPDSPSSDRDQIWDDANTFGDYDWSYTIYAGTGKDNTVGYGRVLNSDSGTIHIGQ